MVRIFQALILLALSLNCTAQSNRIDIIRADAPELARFGDFDIGVRTQVFTDQNRPDILATKRGEDTAYYDRSLTVELWYPALLASGQQAAGQYQSITRNPSVIATLHGKAVRDAEPLHCEESYPLVIISHGYPGNRYLLSHLAENLASKGYVVASIDHKDSTYDDQLGFASTLYNRPLDQRFILSQLAAMSKNAGSFLHGVVNAELTAIVGYSMGGYGLINNLGGGYSDTIVDSLMAPANGILQHHSTGNPSYRDALDSRIKAGIAIAPWGMTNGFWSPEDLHGIQVPTFYIAGSVDTVAGYEKGTRAIFENAINSDRYLLTYHNAGHNAGAPMPVPAEILVSDDSTGSSHYTDPVWDTVRMNNIMAHFITAYLDLHLKGNQESTSWLDLTPYSADGVYSVKQGKTTDEHTYWKGFDQGTAVGLSLEYLPAAK